DIPELVGAAGEAVLPDIAAVSGAGRGDFHDLAAGAVDDDVAAVDGGLDVVAPGDVDHRLGVGLAGPVAGAAGEGDDVGIFRAFAVEEHLPVAGHETVGG